MRFELRPDPEKHVVLQHVHIMTEAEFEDDVRLRRTRSAWPEAFVFIHGYNVSFDDAARRTAQLAYDLGFGGIPAFYSWPSNGTIETYTWDDNSVDNSVDDLVEFLGKLAKAGDLRRIHLIAHSMGARCTAAAIVRGLALGGCSLDRCVLAAPDIDATAFKNNIAPQLVSKVANLTLYASTNDRALMASQAVHRLPRAGDAHEMVVCEGMDSVDASRLETDYLGHSYYGNSGYLIDDLREIINNGTPVAERRGMRPFPISASLGYWIFEPDDK